MLKEIEKNCWILLIFCVTLTSIFREIDISLGLAAGSLICLYSFKLFFVKVSKTFLGVVTPSAAPKTVFFYFWQLIMVSLLLYLALAVVRVDPLGLVAGIVLVTIAICYSSYCWFQEKGEVIQ